MSRRDAGGFNHASDHRPSEIEQIIERHRRQVVEMFRERRMIPRDFSTVVVKAPRGLERSGTRMMHAAVVHNRQAGITEQIRPDVPVQMGITDLVDRQVIVALLLSPYKLVRVQDSWRTRRRRRVWTGR